MLPDLEELPHLQDVPGIRVHGRSIVRDRTDDAFKRDPLVEHVLVDNLLGPDVVIEDLGIHVEHVIGNAAGIIPGIVILRDPVIRPHAGLQEHRKLRQELLRIVLPQVRGRDEDDLGRVPQLHFREFDGPRPDALQPERECPEMPAVQVLVDQREYARRKLPAIPVNLDEIPDPAPIGNGKYGKGFHINLFLENHEIRAFTAIRAIGSAFPGRIAFQGVSQPSTENGTGKFSVQFPWDGNIQ